MPSPAVDEQPALVTFACSLCETRITARVADVGRKVECPDCGRKNVIPPPPKPKKANRPAALDGEQIGVWGVEDKTWEPGFATAAALHPVPCRLCETLMYATEEQIGRELKCPDCGALTVAKRFVPPKRKGPRPVIAGKEYQLDPASAPEPRPSAIPISLRDAELHEHARATTVGPDGRLIVQKVEYKRPELPAAPLIQGVWRMLLTQEVVARWVMMSILFGFAGWFLGSALIPAVGGVAQGIMAVFMAAIGAGLTVLWLTFAAPTCLTIVGESAEGHDRVHDPPAWSPLEWMGESFQLATALAAAGLAGALPTWGLAWGFDKAGMPLPWQVVAAVAVAGPFLVFPLALLGTMLENTPLGVVSPRLLATVVRRPGRWLLFYAEMAALTAAAAGLAFAAMLAGPTGLTLLPLIAMGALVVAMRLLGRLAWWISDATAADEDDDIVDEAAAAHPNLAAARAAQRAARQAAAEAQAK